MSDITSIDSQIDQILKEQFIPERWRKVRLSQLKGKIVEIIKQSKISEIEIDSPNRLIAILSKSNGIGKTHLAMCIYRKYLFEQLQKGADIKWRKGLFAKEYQLLSEISSQYESKKSDRDVIQKYVNLPFLAIDDLFADRINEFSRRIMLNLIDERCDWHGRPTVITSNLTLDQIAEIDTRIASRLQSDVCIELELKEDFRGK